MTKHLAAPRLIAMGLFLASACAPAESPPEQPPPEVGPSLLVNMSAHPDTVGPDDVITYTILVMNDMLGGPDPGTSVQVVGDIPSGTTYVSGTVSDGARYRPDTGQVTWMGPVPRGHSVTVSYDVGVVEYRRLDASIENVAFVTDAFGRETEVRATVSTPDLPPPAPGSDPPDFAQFASLLARAAELQDTTFFTERVAGRPYTCTAGDVTGDGLGGAGPDLCKELGQEMDLVLVSRWRSEGYSTWPEAISREIETYFASALPHESDDFGTGDVRLHAIAESRWLRDERTRRVAIFTAITPGMMWPAPGDPTRTVRAIDFEYADERWEITGIMLADILAGELLTAGASPFVGWQLYPLGGV